VDSWPAGLADDDACRDWGWSPAYGLQRAFDEYLVPNIRERYHLS
jgi:threonine 3-dehydrogenase